MTRATMPSMSEMMDLNRATSYLDPSNGIMAGQTFQTFPQTFPAETVGNTQTGHTSILSRDDKGRYLYDGKVWGVPSLARARTRSYPLIDFRPLGRGHELDSGPDDCGKTALAVWSAARIITGTAEGPWHGEPHGVLFILTEDTPDMIRAQLQAHGLTDEQLSRAHTLTMPELTTTEDDCSEYAAPILPKHVPMLRKICMDLDIRMVVIDTLVDCIGGANSNNRDDMAKVVAALNHWAASDNILVVSIHHNIKGNDGTAKQAAAGAGTLTQKSRTVVAFDIDGDPSDPSSLRHYFQLPKIKGRADHPSFEFRFSSKTMTMDDGTTEKVPYVTEVLPSDVSIDELRAKRRTDAEPPMDADEKSEIAAELYGYILDHGKHMFTADVQKWADGRGWTAKNLRKVYREAGVAQTKQRCPHPRSILYLTDIDLYKGEKVRDPEQAAQLWGTPGKSGNSGKSEENQPLPAGKSAGKSGKSEP